MGGETTGEHNMHKERFNVSGGELREIARGAWRQWPLISIGTTSVRMLESIYWHGMKLLGSRKLSSECPLFYWIGQWDAHVVLGSAGSVDFLPPAVEAFDAVCKPVECSDFDGMNGVTRLLIVPGYPFRVYVFVHFLPLCSRNALTFFGPLTFSDSPSWHIGCAFLFLGLTGSSLTFISRVALS